MDPPHQSHRLTVMLGAQLIACVGASQTPDRFCFHALLSNFHSSVRFQFLSEASWVRHLLEGVVSKAGNEFLYPEGVETWL